MTKKLICMALAAVIALCLLPGCDSAQKEQYGLHAAVLYSAGKSWEDTVSYLE